MKIGSTFAMKFRKLENQNSYILNTYKCKIYSQAVIPLFQLFSDTKFTAAMNSITHRVNTNNALNVKAFHYSV